MSNLLMACCLGFAVFTQISVNFIFFINLITYHSNNLLEKIFLGNSLSRRN